MLRSRLNKVAIGFLVYVVCAPVGVSADQAGGGKCNPSLSLCNPLAVRKAFEATGHVTPSEGSFNGQALVSEDIYIRALKLDKSRFPDGDKPEFIKTLSLIRAGIGQWFAFLGSHDLVEKVLVAGQYNATQVYRDVGYGANYVCGDSDYYWLVVFRDTSRVYIRDGVYKNLKPWLRHVYGKDAPDIADDVIETLKTQRFTQVTGCPVDPQTGQFDKDKDIGKCNDDFRNAVTGSFSKNACGTKTALVYSKKANCPTDQALFDYGDSINSAQLRAYLYQVAGFSEFYTGYGYTANSYNDPLSHEYWTDNAIIKDLPNVQVLRVQCTTQDNSPIPAEDTPIVGGSPYVTEYD